MEIKKRCKYCNKEFDKKGKKEYCTPMCNKEHHLDKNIRKRCKICCKLCFSMQRICSVCQKDKKKIRKMRKIRRLNIRKNINIDIGKKLFEFIIKINPNLEEKIIEGREYKKQYMRDYIKEHYRLNKKLRNEND